MTKIDFFIVGAPKCGTTAMYTYLSSHPDIFMPEWKEPHFFGRDLDFRDQRRPTLTEYNELFSDAKKNTKLGESSVFYLYSETAAEEIHLHNPNAKIIIMLRNPVDMLYSYHSQRLYNGTENIRDFGTALAAESMRRQGRSLPKHIGLYQGLFYKSLANFPEQINRYLSKFGRNNVHVIIFDDFSNDTESAYCNLCDFIGVDANYESTFSTINANKFTRYKWISSLLWKPPKSIQKLSRFLLNQATRDSIRNRIKRLNTSYRPRNELDPKVRKEIAAQFSDSIDQLSKLLDKDLSVWKIE